MRVMHVRVAIDDFGTGYSSLAYIARLPVDIVKIDQSFMQTPDSTAGGSSQNWAFVKAILQLAETMRLQAIAEGVETLEQAEALRLLRCPLAQGYLFAKPVPAEVLDQTVSQWDTPEAGWSGDQTTPP
jgi:diguanylate cyclase